MDRLTSVLAFKNKHNQGITLFILLITNKMETKAKKEILVIDDKESIAKVIAMHFAEEYQVTFFDSALKGIAWLEGGNIPDLIVSDIRMPIMSGDEFLSYIKTNELFNSIPVVMLSSEDSSSQRIRLLESGAEDYIVKPFNPIELKVRLKKILK